MLYLYYNTLFYFCPTLRREVTRFTLTNFYFTFRAVTIATVTAEKPTVTVMCINQWQAPVTKGRFRNSVWLGNPSEATPP